MDKVCGALLVTLVLMSGCRFDTSGIGVPDISDSKILDASSEANQKDSKSDFRHDSLPNDSLPADILKADVFNPCKGVTCTNHSHCEAGVCTCDTGYTGTSCDSCAFAYVGYPNCAVVTPVISPITVGCDQECVSGKTYIVSWSSTNADHFSADLWISNTAVTAGTLQTLTGTQIKLNTWVALPASATGTTLPHSINWIMGGGPQPVNLKVKITVKGPGGSVTAERQVHADY